jgi:hypothetical protein
MGTFWLLLEAAALARDWALRGRFLDVAACALQCGLFRAKATAFYWYRVVMRTTDSRWRTVVLA